MHFHKQFQKYKDEITEKDYLVYWLPRKRSYDQRSATPGNQEQVVIERPQQGTYYIVLYGYDNYSDVGFEAESR